MVDPQGGTTFGPTSGRYLRRLAALGLLALLLAVSPQQASPGPATTDNNNEAISRTPEVLRSCSFDLSNEPLASRGTNIARRDQVIAGLASHACEDATGAIQLLSLPAENEAEFEDWRLFALAEAAIEADVPATAEAALEQLLLEHPASPLRHRAFVLRVTVAASSEEHDRTLSMARAARAAPFPDELRTELDVLAWEAAVALDRDIDIEQEARQLLLHSPLDAIDLEVEERLQNPDGELEWSRHFRSWELVQRARGLTEAKLLDEALEALAAVPEAERGLDWHLTNARTLIRDRRGVDALEVLDHVTTTDLDGALELAWVRVEARLDAATARRGRQNLPSSERQAMREAALRELRLIAQQGEGDPMAIKALKHLFEELADGEHFEETLATLHRLRTVDPGDTTGVKYLWGLGWSEYERRNYSGAVGYWSELAELYPESKSARSGRYWSARAHEALGNPDRARTILEDVASIPVTDFYRKHALVRLGQSPDADEPVSAGALGPVATGRSAAASWPFDPRLSRAELLSDLGIDRLGIEELETLEESVDRRAAYALRSRILARQGFRRESIQNLWRVFPMLGTSGQAVAPAEALQMYYPLDFLNVIERFAADNELPVALLLAMIRQESAFDVKARSFAGARGLMQVMPATAKELAQRMGLPYSRDRLTDPTYSVQLGSRYFRQVLDMFDGNLELALAGYNAGPYRIRRLVRDAGSDLEIDRFLEGLSIEESKTYVKRVVLFANSYRQLYPGLG
jgi:soluble lytic murein transglycosylase